MGKGCYLAKIDIDSVFRNIPVHPNDRHLLGMIWNGALYIDTVLPFGLRFAPKIFNVSAAGLPWIAPQRGGGILPRQLPRWFYQGAALEGDCARNLYLIETTCLWSGINVKNKIDLQFGKAICKLCWPRKSICTPISTLICKLCWLANRSANRLSRWSANCADSANRSAHWLACSSAMTHQIYDLQFDLQVSIIDLQFTNPSPAPRLGCICRIW